MRSSRYHCSFAAGALPGTLQRSGPEAQTVFLKAREEAVQVHGETDEALRVAYAALKQEFEKCGDHWIPRTQAAA
jgi:ChaB protein